MRKSGYVDAVRIRRVAAVVGLLMAWATAPAWAVAPTGACCFADGTCQDLFDFQCETGGGDFIGSSTSCAQVNCRAPLAAPLLSGAGMIAAMSALAGIGFRTVRRRRR